MRPLTLRFAGLRSYRTEQEIDFSDVGLMAVVGDTGAGKSSILEALCYALYGGSTWDARGGGRKLIADGGDGTLRVALTFRARGKTWLVTRTTSAGGSPPSTARLQGLDDDSDIDGVRKVDEAVSGLVGLDSSAFLKAVVLPQGRFQELLQTQNAERVTVLKNVLGLDQLGEVRQTADVLHRRLRPLLQTVEVQRARLLPDPAATAEEASSRLDAAQERVAELERLRAEIATFRTAREDAARREQEYRTAAANLPMIPEDIDEKYRTLKSHDARLTDALAAVDSRLRDTGNDTDELEASLAEADRCGTGVTDTATALAALRSLQTQIPALEDERRALADKRVALDAEQTALRERTAAHADLAAKVDRARADADGAQCTLDAATRTLDRCGALLGEYRRTAGAASVATGLVEERRKRLHECEGTAEKAQRAATDAHQALDAAARHLENLNRVNSAVHAASASHPGEPCPVCDRPLPDTFTAPTCAETLEATTSRSRAEKRAGALATESTGASTARSTAKALLGEALAGAQKAVDGRDQARAAASAAGGEVGPDTENETILGPVRERVRTASDAWKTLEETAKAAETASTTDLAELGHTERTLTERERALAEDVRAFDRRRSQVTDAHDGLPAAFRVDGEPTVTAIEDRISAAERRSGELAGVIDRLNTTRKRTTELRRRKEQLDREYRAEVEQPATHWGRLVQTLSDRSVAAARLTGVSPAPARPSPSSLTEDADWALRVTRDVEAITRRCRNEALHQNELAVQAGAATAAALCAANIADESTLAGLLTAVGADVILAKRERDAAIAQRPLCAELDRRICAAKPVIDSLEELVGLLADGKFPNTVVKRRQRALLGIGSKLLQSMTGNRFAFSEDFRIVDGHTGQPRDVKTLSGGETFLASLALALALVELTARGGGRIEALFLDEGFGSLDSNSLDDALEALSRQASGGRLVAAISHMRDVAENVDDVLLVSRSVGGSSARWLTPAERDQLVTDEVASGLLTQR